MRSGSAFVCFLSCLRVGRAWERFVIFLLLCPPLFVFWLTRSPALFTLYYGLFSYPARVVAAADVRMEIRMFLAQGGAGNGASVSGTCSSLTKASLTGDYTSSALRPLAAKACLLLRLRTAVLA